MTRRRRPQILLDTGPLYALLDDGDSKHQTVVRILEELEAANAEIYCAYPAALETHRLILTRKRVTVAHAHALVADTLEIFLPEMPLLEDAELAVANLTRYNDQKISLADATIAAMAQRLRFLVLTFDERQRHFELLGAQLYSIDQGTIHFDFHRRHRGR